jgi:tRNA C32,U32 (ribose-2'-O)-methylase TrmJ|tara:strand:+ start:121 stop:405 length:285 start_codon:yes stop_codon:yes gene_type:complete
MGYKMRGFSGFKSSPAKQKEGTLIDGTKYTVTEKPMTKEEAHAKKTKELQNKLDVKKHHDAQKEHMKKKLKEMIDKDPETKKKMKMLEKLMKII